jgi:hypothetical protein
LLNIKPTDNEPKLPSGYREKIINEFMEEAPNYHETIAILRILKETQALDRYNLFQRKVIDTTLVNYFRHVTHAIAWIKNKTHYEAIAPAYAEDSIENPKNIKKNGQGNFNHILILRNYFSQFPIYIFALDSANQFEEIVIADQNKIDQTLKPKEFPNFPINFEILPDFIIIGNKNHFFGLYRLPKQ